MVPQVILGVDLGQVWKVMPCVEWGPGPQVLQVMLSVYWRAVPTGDAPCRLWADPQVMPCVNWGPGLQVMFCVYWGAVPEGDVPC